MKKRTMCAVLLFTVSACFAQTMEEQIAQGIALHNSALETGPTQAVAAQELLYPHIEKNMIARSYYGSALTIEASFYEKENPVKSLGLLEKGAFFMDSAVGKDPENYELRITRLVNGIEVSRSSPFKRYSVIKYDVAWFEKNGISYSKDENAQIFYSIALYYLDFGDIDSALDALGSCIETKATIEAVKKAQLLLRRYEE